MTIPQSKAQSRVGRQRSGARGLQPSQPSQRLPWGYTPGLEGFAAGVGAHPNTTRTHVPVSMVLWELCIPTPWLRHGLALCRSCR